MKLVRVALIVVLLCAYLLVPARRIAAAGSCEPDGVQSSGAVYRICMPENEWNGDLVLYAHGYVAFNEPVAIPEDQLALPGGPSIPDIVNGLRYAFATTSYSVNGLAIRQGLDDLIELVDIFTAAHGAPNHIYVVGPSEGGIVTALAIEGYPEIYDGGVSACGPVGDFPSQINYWGDVRVVFDYFFPDLLPGSAVQIPGDVIDAWETVYSPQIENALVSQPLKRNQLMKVARIPQNSLNEQDNIEAILELLWYNVFATNDGTLKLGGQPFDNSQRVYYGSDNNVHLNLSVERFTAAPAAVAEMQAFYQTSGNVTKPIVMLHTVDPIIPAWQESIYALEVAAAGKKDQHTYLPVLWRYGHCNFSPVNLLLAFVILVSQATGTLIADAEQVLHTEEQRAEYRELVATYLHPVTGDGTLYLPWINASIP